MRTIDCIKVLIIAAALAVAWPSHAQAQEVSIRVDNVPVAKFLDLLQKQSGYVVILIQPVFGDHPHVTVSADHQPLEKLLREVLTPLGAEYVLVENNIVIRQTTMPHPGTETRIIAGRILDSLGNSIPNATIRLKFENLGGVISDKEGRFRLAIRASAGRWTGSGTKTLVISSVGYQTFEYPLTVTDSFVLVSLRDDIGSLDAAQVTAYGETTHRLTTAGSQSISAATLAQYPIDNALDAVQDLTTGVFIQRQSGASGSAYSSHIRGINSLSGSTNTSSQPLIIVDGVTYPGSILPFLINNLPVLQQGGNGLNYLLPDMIESITVLKDADALSIYGSRGAYGVILIKTKSGRSHSPGLSFRQMTGIDAPGITPHLLNTQQYLMIRREALANDGLTPGSFDLDLNGTWSSTGYINWPRYFYRPHSGLNDSYLTWHDGNDLFSWSVGGGFRYDGGPLVNGNGSKTGGLHYNLNAFQNKKLSLAILGGYTHTDNTNTAFEPLAYYNGDRVIQYAPNAPPMLDPDHALDWSAYPQGDPAADIRMVYRNQTNNTVTGATLTYKPVSKFSLTLGFGYNAISGVELEGFPAAWSNPNTSPSIQSMVNRYRIDTWTAEPNANFSTRIGPGAQLSVTMGATAQQQKNYTHILAGTGLTSNTQLTDPGSAPTADQTRTVEGYDKRYLGFFGLVNYSWREKYILNIGLRRDGSSVFGAEEQFGNFYSIGAAYILSREPWFKHLLPCASFAKLRSSFGLVGGDNIKSGQDAATYVQSLSYEGSPGQGASELANPYLHWEKDRKWNASLELHFVKDRIAVQLEYYHSHVYDQLSGVPLSYVTGFSGIATNNPNAIITGYGVEYSLHTENIVRSKFKWSTGINFTLPRNILTSFPGLAADGISNLQLGRSVQGAQVYDYQGVNPQDGRLLFKNAAGRVGEYLFAGSQLLTQQDRTRFVDLSPNYFGSVINTLVFGRWRLDIDAGFVSRMGLSYYGSESAPPGAFNANYPKEVLTRWQKPGDRTKIPAVSTGIISLFSWAYFDESTGAYTHAGYWRLNNLYLAYRLPSGRLRHVSECTLFVQGQNLLTITKYHDYDPATQGAGMPLRKRIAGGIRLEL